MKESSFVHDLTIDASSVQYVLASENSKQLKDLEHFCTQPLKFSVFSIDSNYKVGNFYVSNVSKISKLPMQMVDTGVDIHMK